MNSAKMNLNSSAAMVSHQDGTDLQKNGKILNSNNKLFVYRKML